MKYWDASALVPVLFEKEGRNALSLIMEEDSIAVSWWGTPVEVFSAIWRRRRGNPWSEEEFAVIVEEFGILTDSLHLVDATPQLRERALRLLAMHPLKSGDALQLASALHWAEENPRGMHFVCIDKQLATAARAEGFTVLP